MAMLKEFLLNEADATNEYADYQGGSPAILSSGTTDDYDIPGPGGDYNIGFSGGGIVLAQMPNAGFTNGLEKLSARCKIKMPSDWSVASPNTAHSICGNWDGGIGLSWRFYWHNNFEIAYFQVRLTDNSSPQATVDVTSLVNMYDGEWHDLEGWFDRSSQRIYIDVDGGAATNDVATNDLAIQTSAGNALIGGVIDSTPDFPGGIAGVGVADNLWTEDEASRTLFYNNQLPSAGVLETSTKGKSARKAARKSNWNPNNAYR